MVTKSCYNIGMACRRVLDHISRKEHRLLDPDDVYFLRAKGRKTEGVRAGTVDKFQGQQAQVVIYSMASSSADDAPREMSFLYNPNRLNVATSRARCVCILVGAPQILEPDRRTPDHMRWANGLCRFRELATVVPAEKAVRGSRSERL